MKKWQIFLTWFLYLCAVSSAYDLTRYLIEHDLFSRGYTVIIGLMFMFLGWLGARLEIKFAGAKKRK